MAAMTTLAPPRPQPKKATFSQQEKHGGLLVSKEREDAVQRCKLEVEEIVKDCREKNSKFRDIEFDLENDKDRCLHGLGIQGPDSYSPSDVQRVTQIFDKPLFFMDGGHGVNSNDIFQGGIGDCWFCSALSTMSAAQGLVEKCCIARDEKVGVYGFIFFRDTKWVVVIIDDLLYTKIPTFEELEDDRKILYHNDRELYNKWARKGGKGLYFARSGIHGETWVPLIEKAYAKLHGCYLALHGGQTCEAIEDMTGGVSSFIPSRDILDKEKFWETELRFANKGKLFGCSFHESGFNSSPEDKELIVNGLFAAHAYSVLRAVEYKGKRFLVIRNPHGKSEWTGSWSDGSKEWTPESIFTLNALDHTFGNDGQFVMEYEDFLEHWQYIDRVRLFDSPWLMSSQWLRVTSRPLSHAWTFGDVSFTITLDIASSTVIVLSQLDDRYYEPISGCADWSFDFIVFRKGEKKPVTRSSYSRPNARSVNVETYLEAGVYVVHVRLDREPRSEQPSITTVPDYRQLERLHSRVLTEKAKSQSIASNIMEETRAKFLPIPLDVLAGQDISELEAKAVAANKEMKKKSEALMMASKNSDSDTDKGRNGTEQETEKKECEAEKKEGETEKKEGETEKEEGETEKKERETENPDNKVESSEGTTSNPDQVDERDEWNAKEAPNISLSEQNIVYLGLRVYTEGTSAEICGQLRHEMATSFEGLAIHD